MDDGTRGRVSETDIDPLRGLGDRTALFCDLGAAAAADRSRLLILLELVGVRGYADELGSAAAEELLDRTAKRLQAAVGDTGTCYRLRGTEFCALVDDPGSGRRALLDTLAAALAEDAPGGEVEAVASAVLLPEEAHDAARALELADRQLNLRKREHGVEPDPLFDPRHGGEEPAATAPRGGLASIFRGYDNVKLSYRSPTGQVAIGYGALVRYSGSRAAPRGASRTRSRERMVELENVTTRECFVVPVDEVEPDQGGDHRVVQLLP
jgi:GGDEF domain-containing protein